MKPIRLAPVAAAAALAACSGDAPRTGEKAAAAPGAAAPPAAAAPSPGLMPQAGLYKTTITMTGLEFPGMPPEMEGHGAGLARTLETCLTQAEVDKGLTALLTRGQNGACRFERLAFEAGAFEGVMVCEADGATTRTTMSGTASATGADYTASTGMSFGDGVRGTMTVAGQHRRIGDCPAG
ncbi:DUF3617 domain-containing protein [Erythrobacter cryptus]|uniref:DUF3617 domain-containing protein n=1 Tax=Erythrobacter cryptus TaxID=196588 RepID=UPI00040063A3|nr:DUF3617 domain-containing protein [Erythrobacter cryptus]